MADQANGNGGGRAPRSIKEAGQLIEHADYERLWNCYHAIKLLAGINNELASASSITHDDTAAVAIYARDELLAVLKASKLEGES
ncbi:hypothetical protein [Pseudoxanthomonas winnipegensis]|uniref:Uncharacterized protein n=1 Tax=Pseudoxanthomonas winnipegensis TaxID=2480810 RepID=A0A4Q8LCE6_9GAMM|nr:hypothetical protein [Pseudoxanthomonas winnipegensis]TAA26548.1 hypothetical protein EA660_04765 [Pseudoxanthomonas winnipegensis]